MRLISDFFFGARTWPRRIAAITVFFALVMTSNLLLIHWHAERVTSAVVRAGVFLTACWVARYVAGGARAAPPRLAGVSGIGLVAGGLCGYAVVGAYHLKSSAAIVSIEGGAIVGMILCVVIYAATVLWWLYRDDSGRFSKRMMLMGRPPIVDRSPATSRRINER